MKKILLKICLLMSVFGLPSCAVNSGVPQTTQARAVPDAPVAIELECKVANRLGCRHKGRIFPWNAWAEVMGYDSTRYAVKEVIPSGNRAKVLIVKR